MKQKTRTVTRVIKEQIPWNRKEGVADILSKDAVSVINSEKCDYITINPDGTSIISIPNEAADAYEEYEVKLLDSATVQLLDTVRYKVIRKIDDQPL